MQRVSISAFDEGCDALPAEIEHAEGAAPVRCRMVEVDLYRAIVAPAPVQRLHCPNRLTGYASRAVKIARLMREAISRSRFIAAAKLIVDIRPTVSIVLPTA